MSNYDTMGFEAKIEGTYFAIPTTPGQSGVIQKKFTEECVLPDAETAQYILQQVILPQKLAERFPDFKSLRTCEVVSFVPRDPNNTSPVPFDFLSKVQLAKFIKEHDLSDRIDPADYRDIAITELRKDIKMAMNKPEVYERRRARRKVELRAVNMAMKLNPGLNLTAEKALNKSVAVGLPSTQMARENLGVDYTDPTQASQAGAAPAVTSVKSTAPEAGAGPSPESSNLDDALK